MFLSHKKYAFNIWGIIDFPLISVCPQILWFAWLFFCVNHTMNNATLLTQSFIFSIKNKREVSDFEM